MSKAKLQAAKELINEKKYDEARALLKTIDDKTAREWEAKLEKLTKATSNKKKPLAPSKPKKKISKTGCLLWGAVFLIFVYIASDRQPSRTPSSSSISTPERQTVASEITATSESRLTQVATNTMSASATITETPLPTSQPTAIPGSDRARIETGATQAAPLAEAMRQVQGVRDVKVSVVPARDGGNTVVGAEVIIAAGTDMLGIATELRDLSYKVLRTAFIDFWVILSDGQNSVDYMWDNRTDSWRITPLTTFVTTSPNQTVQQVEASTYYLTRNANVRSCPNSECDRIGIINQGTRVTVLGIAEGEVVVEGNSRWYQVEYGGDAYFIYSAYLTRFVPTATPQVGAPTPLPQSQIVTGYTGPIPRNCTEARQMGIDEVTAALINPNLDGDTDGKACYDDQ